MQIGNREFELDKKTYVMAILNVTPDSFSDGGKLRNMDEVLNRVELLMREGADIIDIGGESTRPGYTQISAEEEIERVAPVIKEIKTRFNIPVSLDTHKGAVAKAGIDAGADMINDIWGLQYDTELAGIISQNNIPCCLMHNRKEAIYADFINDVITDLKKTIQIAKNAGISDDKIILDPGVGFAKDYKQNLEVINRLDELKRLEYPLLLGASRKSVVGLALNLPVEERLEGTLATTVMAVMRGCGFVRVHDVLANKRVIQMTEAILGK